MKLVQSLAAALAGLLLSSSLAAAACSQADLQGNWRFHFWNQSNYWFHCRLVVAADGAISSAQKCFDDGGGKLTVNTGGKLKMAQANFCKVTGKVKVKKGTAALNMIIGDSTMSLDKGVVTGGGDTGELVIFYLTKY